MVKKVFKILILIFLSKMGFAQQMYKVTIIRAQTNFNTENNSKMDTLVGTLKIPEKSSLNEIELQIDSGIVIIPNHVWKCSNNVSPNKLAVSNLKLHDRFYVLNNGLLNEAIFYPHREKDFTCPKDFKNIVALQTTSKTIIFGHQEKNGLSQSCYSVEILKSSFNVSLITIDFNSVENTSAFERDISEKWIMTPEE
jgi:hypothetical protein